MHILGIATLDWTWHYEQLTSYIAILGSENGMRGTAVFVSFYQLGNLILLDHFEASVHTVINGPRFRKMCTRILFLVDITRRTFVLLIPIVLPRKCY